MNPSKRAKTEDEKEQRRIERVLRNRQAAQSSRERKRQEVEKLEGEKHTIERQNYLLRQRLMQVEHEKFQLQQELAKARGEKAPVKNTASKALLASSGPPSPMSSSTAIKQELDDYLPSPQTTPQPMHPRSSFSSESPSSSRSSSPTGTDFDARHATPSDMTQHPAAMLCGLQCLSEAATWRPSSTRCSSAEQRRRHPSAASTRRRRRSPPRPSATHLPCRTLLSTVLSTPLSPLSPLFTSSKPGSRPSTASTPPTTFLLMPWLISTPGNNPLVGSLTRNLLPTQPPSPITQSRLTPSTPTSLAAPCPRTSFPNPSSSRRATTASTFRISLLRRLLASSPIMARPSTDATGRALQMKTRYALRGSSGRSGIVERSGEADVESREWVKASLERCGVRADTLGLGDWLILLRIWSTLATLEKEEKRPWTGAKRRKRRERHRIRRA